MSTGARPTPEQYEQFALMSAAAMTACADLAAVLWPIVSAYAEQATALYKYFQEVGLIDENGKPAQFIIDASDTEETP